TNGGIIIANQNNSLTIDPTGDANSATPGVINSGTMRADAGGNLVLNGGNFQNFNGPTPGLIRANSGTVLVQSSLVNGGTVDVSGTGQIQLNTSTISGGTLANSSSGTIRTVGGTSTI